MQAIPCCLVQVPREGPPIADGVKPASQTNISAKIRVVFRNRICYKTREKPNKQQEPVAKSGKDAVAASDL